MVPRKKPLHTCSVLCGILKPSLTKELSFEISLLLAVGPGMDFKAVATENKAFRILYMGCYDGWMRKLIPACRLASHKAKRNTLTIQVQAPGLGGGKHHSFIR